MKSVKLSHMDLRAEPYKTIETLGKIEFFYSADHKLCTRPADDTLGYRERELHTSVIEKLNHARAEHRYPSKAFIDALIKMQRDRSIERAVKYVEYRYLGSAGYLEVFGHDAEIEDNILKHYAECQELKDEIKQMHEESLQTQQLLINIAVALNEQMKQRSYK